MTPGIEYLNQLLRIQVGAGDKNLGIIRDDSGICGDKRNHIKASVFFFHIYKVDIGPTSESYSVIHWINPFKAKKLESDFTD